ncbi:dienelactone hydrolase family protein [Ornithinimicrobium sp. Arc0846-15]|nr:dienelactone hydrolase family protein [Ornithinimicrobium laminariae]
MAEVLLFHHIQGLTQGVRAFADDLRSEGHVVHTPDLFEGRTFASIEQGMAFARQVGFDTLQARGATVVEGLRSDLVYAGFSFGVTMAQQLAQTRPGALGALLMYSCLPVSEFGEVWPPGVPVQIHGKEGDEFFAEDLPGARELAASTSEAELFVYPGGEHLFADASLSDFDPEAAALMLSRVQALLAKL